MSTNSSTLLGLPAQSRYILFDQTGDRGRIMFGPDIFCEFPNDRSNNGVEQDVVYGEAMASAFTALQSMRDSRSFSVTLCRLQDERVVSKSSVATATATAAVIVKEASKVSNNNYERAPESSSTHEDTRDIEALLYSEDEESSTGHSPSQVTSDQDEDDDDKLEVSSEPADAAATTAAVAAKTLNNRSSKGFKSYTGYLSVRKNSRKEKIRQTVKLLQSIVPGGDGLDPSMILDQAIHYMKSLQMKVLELEATRSSYHQQPPPKDFTYA